jgi:class 3 adenylate cyclase
MDGLTRRLLAIGADAADDEDTSLRKLLLLAAAFTIAPLAVVWGLLYWVAGAQASAAIPWAYSILSAVGIGVFAVTRRYDWFALSQFAPYVTLPFLLMWSLGGPIHGSVVAIWAGLAPLVASLLGHRRLAAALVAIYALLVVVAVLVPADDGAILSASGRDLFFVLNLAAVPFVAWLLLRVFTGGREDALESMRSVVRRYLPRDFVAALRSDPHRLDLGGQVADVTILFADLGGYSTYAETRAPGEVVELLNRYFAAALPAILEEGGTPMQLPGDAVLAVFGAPTPRPDHAVRAYRAACAILERTAHLAEPPTRGPQFRIGVNSGPALVGNIGSEEYRNFTAIGDTTNVAARLQGVAGAGEVVMGPETARLIADSAHVEPLGAISVKGRSQPVDAYRIRPGAQP